MSRESFVRCCSSVADGNTGVELVEGAFVNIVDHRSSSDLLVSRWNEKTVQLMSRKGEDCRNGAQCVIYLLISFLLI